MIGFAAGSAHAALPVLSMVHLTTLNGRLQLTTSNLEAAARVVMGAKVESDISICVPYTRMSAYVDALPDGVVNLSVRGTTMSVVCGAHRSTLNGLDALDFPIISGPNDAVIQVLLEGRMFAKLATVTYAAATDEQARPALAGAHLVCGVTTVRAECANEAGLAQCTVPVSGAGEFEVLVPAKLVIRAARIFQADQPVLVALSESRAQVYLVQGDITVVSALIDHRYPDLNRVIPEKRLLHATVDKAQLVTTLRAVDALLDSERGVAQMTFQHSDSARPSLEIAGRASESGAGEGCIELSAMEGDNLIIGLNTRQLMSVLSTIDTREVSIAMAGQMQPVLVQGIGDESCLHVVMPYRLPGAA